MNRRMAISGLALVAMVSVLLVDCSSSDPYEATPQEQRPRSMGEGRGGGRAAGMGGPGQFGGLDMLLPDQWWREADLSLAVNLSTEQFAALDKIDNAQGDEINRLTRDMQVATRELRDALDADPAKGETIVAAGERLRAMRDNLTERQLRMLAAEREVLSHQQWTALQSALQSRRREGGAQERRGGASRGRGGWGGGMGGGGRRPGWPG